MLAPGGCDYVASPERLVDTDVISIAMVLVAGESQAHLLVGHPYLKRSDPPPEVTATLIGPGWRAASPSRTLPRDGCGGGPTDWPISMVCLNFWLPEPIREEFTYRLEGRGPQGSFAGETTVPAAPRILDPADTVWLESSTAVVRIPISYETPSLVGTLRPEVFQIVGEGTGTDSTWVWPWPWELDVDGWRDTLVWGHTARLERASLHLLGIGRQYTYFWNRHMRHATWLSVGLTGKGVYGYFDASAKSSPIEIRLKDER